MAKRQKKYVTRESILKDIDAAHRKIKKLTSEAADLDLIAEMAKVCGNQAAYEVNAEEAERLWKRAERMENTRLKKLGATLAAFDSVPMFGDSQVVLQKV